MHAHDEWQVAELACCWVQCEDEHPYALHTYLIEELNKLGIAYVHMIEPRAPHSMGVKSPNAEFDFFRRDQNLDVRPLNPPSYNLPEGFTLIKLSPAPTESCG